MIIEPTRHTIEQDSMLQLMYSCGWELKGWVNFGNDCRYMEAILGIGDTNIRILPNGKIDGFKSTEESRKLAYRKKELEEIALRVHIYYRKRYKKRKTVET